MTSTGTLPTVTLAVAVTYFAKQLAAKRMVPAVRLIYVRWTAAAVGDDQLLAHAVAAPVVYTPLAPGAEAAVVAHCFPFVHLEVAQSMAQPGSRVVIRTAMGTAALAPVVIALVAVEPAGHSRAAVLPVLDQNWHQTAMVQHQGRRLDLETARVGQYCHQVPPHVNLGESRLGQLSLAQHLVADLGFGRVAACYCSLGRVRPVAAAGGFVHSH